MSSHIYERSACLQHIRRFLWLTLQRRWSSFVLLKSMRVWMSAHIHGQHISRDIWAMSQHKQRKVNAGKDVAKIWNSLQKNSILLLFPASVCLSSWKNFYFPFHWFFRWKNTSRHRQDWNSEFWNFSLKEKLCRVDDDFTVHLRISSENRCRTWVCRSCENIFRHIVLITVYD